MRMQPENRAGLVMAGEQFNVVAAERMGHEAHIRVTARPCPRIPDKRLRPPLERVRPHKKKTLGPPLRRPERSEGCDIAAGKLKRRSAETQDPPRSQT